MYHQCIQILNVEKMNTFFFNIHNFNPHVAKIILVLIKSYSVKQVLYMKYKYNYFNN